MADIFLRLTPAESQAHVATAILQLEKNSIWYSSGAHAVADHPTIGSRDPTPAPDLSPPPALKADESLVLTFTKLFRLVEQGRLPSLRDGICFGTDPSSCHVLLGYRGIKGISRRQLSIDVDNEGRVWLRDCGSTYGTGVQCDDQNGQYRQRNYVWALAEHPGLPDIFRKIVTQTGTVNLAISLPSHASSSAEYRENLQALYQKCKEASTDTDGTTAIKRLGVESVPTTAKPSGLTTPNARKIFYRLRNLGNGNYSQVWLIIEAHSGRYFAAKTLRPLPRNSNYGALDSVAKLEAEFAFTADFQHANIVQTLELHLSAEPTMIMTYYPDGNITDVGAYMRKVDYITACGQVLSALQHLHSRRVIHRDLKPENVLVRRHPLLTFVVADFGLANIEPADTFRRTFCGSLNYAAPEIFPGLSNGHNSQADIWSAGAMTLHLIYGIPQLPAVPSDQTGVDWWSWRSSWYGALRSTLADQEDCTLTAMLNNIVEEDVYCRWTARMCLDFGLVCGCLFQMRRADGLVVCVDDPIDTVLDDSCYQQTSAAVLPQHRFHSSNLERLHHSTVQNGDIGIEKATSCHDIRYLSGGTVLKDRDDIYVLLETGHRITMRLSTYDLNASEIAAAVGIDTFDHNNCRTLFKEYKFKLRSHCFWAPFCQGVLLCREYGLEKDIMNLLSHSPYPLPASRVRLRDTFKPTSLPSGFAAILWMGGTVVWRPNEGSINVTQIYKRVFGLDATFQEYTERLSNKATVRGSRHFRGTYLNFVDALTLCAHFHIDPQPMLYLVDLPKLCKAGLLDLGQDEEGEAVETERPSGEAVASEPDEMRNSDSKRRAFELEKTDVVRGHVGPIGQGDPPSPGRKDIDHNQATQRVHAGPAHASPIIGHFAEASFSRGSFLAQPWTSFDNILG
ncbi:hypothetical protein LTR95_002453 [Oleoguttula sp. CCFEE 5521]